MKPPIQWKLTALLLFLALLFVLIQWLLIFSFEISLSKATLLGFVTVSIIAFLSLKSLTPSIKDRSSKTTEEVNVHLENKMNEISREKDYLLTVLKGMAEGILVVNERGRIRMVNEALIKLFSLPREVIDKIPLELIRNAELEEALRSAIKGGKDAAFELTLPFFPERNFEVTVVGLPPLAERNHQEGGIIGGAIAVFHDITRLKELERVRQDFVANVSHQLRTPLTTIKGYAETLLEGALKEEVAYSFVHIIQRNADRLTKIVEDLLMLSKIDSKEAQLKKEAIRIEEVIHDVLDDVKESAERKKIDIFQSEISPPLSVKADRSSLEQVLINLFDNAIKYSHEGGRIIISVIEKEQNEIQFSIRDNGIGIPKEDLPRIFERFYRVDKGRAQELGGTGLGLSIVKHIVQAHGGRVWVESRWGEGSTFYFTLPAYRK
jgi:two-component system phosphate regulon sensor histidine kinase PhoR